MKKIRALLQQVFNKIDMYQPGFFWVVLFICLMFSVVSFLSIILPYKEATGNHINKDSFICASILMTITGWIIFTVLLKSGVMNKIQNE